MTAVTISPDGVLIIGIVLGLIIGLLIGFVVKKGS